MAPEIDPVLTDTQNWDSHSHRALYESVHINNDPGQSGEIGSEWAQFATELGESAQIITERIVATETGWTGESADGARTAIKKLSDWISGTAQTAGQVGDRVADQGRVMQDARASMPEPLEFTWAGATGNMVGGGLSGLLASTADVQAASAKAQAAKELAVTVMTNMETNSRAIDQSTPVFTAPFNPVTGKTQEPQLVAMRRVEASGGGGAVEGLPAMSALQTRREVGELGLLQSQQDAGEPAGAQVAVAPERTTAAAAALAPPVMPSASFDGGGGFGGAGGSAGSGGAGAGGVTGGGHGGGAVAAGGGGYAGGAYKGSSGSGYSGGDSDENGSAYRQGGTTTAAEAAASIPVMNGYTPPAVGGIAGAGGHSDPTNHNGSTGYGNVLSGNAGRGGASSRTPAPGSAGNPAGHLGGVGARPPGVPAEGVGGPGSTGRGAGGFGSAGSGGFSGGSGAGGFGGGAGVNGLGGSAAGFGGTAGGVGGSGAGGSAGVIQPGGRGQTPTGAFPGGAQGVPGMTGAPMGGAPMGGAPMGGRSEEDKEHKSASYIMGGDLFDMPGENLPPSVIGGVKPKKKSGDQS